MLVHQNVHVWHEPAETHAQQHTSHVPSGKRSGITPNEQCNTLHGDGDHANPHADEALDKSEEQTTNQGRHGNDGDDRCRLYCGDGAGFFSGKRQIDSVEAVTSGKNDL